MKQTAVSLLIHLYTWLLRLYPSGFRDEFEDEMRAVFNDGLADVKMDSWSNPMILFAHELRDLPGSLWREHLDTRRKFQMNQNLTWRPPTTKELLVAMTIFVLPAIRVISARLFQHQSSINLIMTTLTLAILAFILIVCILGSVQGFPRWSVPFVGIVVTTFVMLELSWRIWETFYPMVYQILGGKPSTLPTRIIYQALGHGFSWLTVFVGCVLLVLLLMAWPRTRHLAQRIRLDWTLFSFLLYGGVIFALELVFEEYRYDELWRIACYASLALGAWIYLKSKTSRKRILALLVGVTLTFWIAAVGKWIIIPQQSWGAWYGNHGWAYRRFELGGTIAQWAWVVFFMLMPALLTLMGHPPKIVSVPEEGLVEERSNSP